MSRKRPEKSDSNDLPDDFENGNGLPDDRSGHLDDSEFAAKAANDPEPGDDEEMINEAEMVEEEKEFSLDQLSRAYARVLNKESEDSTDLEDGKKGLDRPIPAAARESDDIEAEQVESAEDEVDDDAACPISPESIIEAILFVGSPKDVKLTSRKIASVLRDVSPKEVTKIIKKINSRYEAENAAYRIGSDKGDLKLLLDDSLNEFQQEFFGRNKQVRLSQAAINVMAVVAYNQPLTREQVEKIRAKPSGSILAQLVRRNLLYIVPEENASAKKRRYATTDKFLDFFNLEEIADLPQSHEASDFDELAD